MTESELVKRCRKGDRDAQRELYEQTSERIYRLLLRMTRSQDAAIDLAQETYVRAFSRIAQFNGQSTLATWLYRIAVNEALQFLRRHEPKQLSPDSELAVTVGDSENNGRIAALDVAEALGRMDDLDRTVLLLRYQEGLDYSSIADVMGCPAGTVASRLNRARQRARDLLAGGYESREESRKAMHLINGDKCAGTITTPADPVRMEKRRP